jgi:hypothetical protein
MSAPLLIVDLIEHGTPRPNPDGTRTTMLLAVVRAASIPEMVGRLIEAELVSTWDGNAWRHEVGSVAITDREMGADGIVRRCGTSKEDRGG